MPSPFESGQTVGRYRILRPLGTGAMGVVYLARDPQIERLLAIKTVRLAPDEPADLAERTERLLREAKTAGRLIHPHIVTLFDAGEHEGTLYLAFEYVEGSNLSERIRDGAPLTLGEALRITGEAASGLTFAHRRGIVHRDVKPANLLLTSEGQVKISDFGIAKVLGEATELTMTGSVVGSPHYLSPEQVRGEPLDGRSDLFSLGVVLYELLGARRPFDGETLTTLLYQILHQEPLPMIFRPVVSTRLVDVLSRLLAKDRDERFGDADELAAALAELETELPPAVLAAPAVAAGSDGAVEPTRFLSMTGAVPVAPATRPAEAPGEPAGTRAPGVPPPPDAVPPPPPGAAPAQAVARPQRAPARRRRVWVVAAAALAVLAVAAGLAAFGGYHWWQRTVTERMVRSEDPRTLEAEPGAQGSGPRVQSPLSGEEGVEDTGLDTGEAAAAGERSGQPHPVAAAGREVTTGVASPEPEPVAAAPLLQRPAPTLSALEPAAQEVAAPDSAGAVEPGPPPGAMAEDRGPRPRAARRLEQVLEERPEIRERVEELVERSAPDQEVETGLAVVFDVQPPQAFVLLDGTVIGRAREHAARGGVPYVLPGPGDYLLKLRSPGMEDHRVLVRASVSGPSRTTISARLQPAAAAELDLGDLPLVRVQRALGFDVHPPTAEIHVDGRRVGRVDRYPGRFARPATWLRLPAGRHRLSLVAPGFVRRDFAVDVSDGAAEERQRLEVRLVPTEGAS